MSRFLNFIGLSLLASQVYADQSDWQFSLEVALKSRYVGGTAGALFTDKPVVQGSLFASHQSGLYLGVWQSLPTDPKYKDTFARETDYIVGYSRAIGIWRADLSFSLYDLLPISDLYALNFTISATKGSIRPYAVVEHDFAERAQLPSGTIYKAGIRGDLPRTPIRWDWSLLGNYSSDGHPYGFRQDALSCTRLQLSLPIKVGEATLSPSVVFQKSLGHQPKEGGIAGNQVVWAIAYSLSF